MRETKKKVTADAIVQQLRALNLERDAIVFISADLLRIGYFNKTIDQTLIDWIYILKEAFGSSATLVIPAYTNTFSRFNKDPTTIFSTKSEPASGALSKAFFHYGNARRSLHPSHSCFAIGPEAEYILKGHDHTASCYAPYHKVIESGGKNLLLGTIDQSNGPMAFHAVQESLNQTLSHPSANLYQTYFLDQYGEVKLFTRKDVGGCTRGLFKTYGHLIIHGAMEVFETGKARSALIDARKSFDIIKSIMSADASLIMCDDKMCTSCRGRYCYNKFGILKFWPKKIMNLLLSRILPAAKI